MRLSQLGGWEKKTLNPSTVNQGDPSVRRPGRRCYAIELAAFAGVLPGPVESFRVWGSRVLGFRALGF